MAPIVDVRLQLTIDAPDTMTFADIHAGLDEARLWYRVNAEADGSVSLSATPEGFEWLGRMFLKLARTPRHDGFHMHFTAEHSGRPPMDEPELTIAVVSAPPPAV